MSAWPIFDVTVSGFPTFQVTAATRSKARWESFQRFLVYDDRASFKDFIARCSVRRRSEEVAVDGYDYVRRAYGLEVAIGDRVRIRGEGPNWNGREGSVIYPGQSTAYVKVVMDGEDRESNFHPMSVEIIGPGERP